MPQKEDYQKVMKIRPRDYLRLKEYSEKHGIPMTEALAIVIKKLEAKKVKMSETEEKAPEIELVECGECGELVPEDSSFCPYCGVEFEDEEEEEEEESEEEDE